MKRLTLTLAGALVLLLAACQQVPWETESPAPSQQSQSMKSQISADTFTGEIMDSACAALGSHENMMMAEGAKNARECTLECVKMGSHFVLYNKTTKATYQLDDQKKPEKFAGRHVQINGTLDSSSHTIHIDSIMAG